MANTPATALKHERQSIRIRKSVKSFDSLGVANAVDTSKPIMQVKISLPLTLVAVLILICNVVLPAQAEGDNPTEQTQEAQTQQALEENNRKHPLYSESSNDQALLVNKDKWPIAKANIEKFLSMNGAAIADLFGSKRTYELPCKIDINDRIVLQFYSRKSLPIRDFYISLSEPRQQTFHSFNHEANGGFELKESPDTIWTGAKRKSEKGYWKIIKANLDKFIGMSGDEIIALLGPERCSSKPRNFIQYRIGDAGLTFFLKAGKVHKFKFKSDAYIPGT